MMRSTNFYLFLVYLIAQKVDKTNLFLVIFKLRLLFKSVVYWPKIAKFYATVVWKVLKVDNFSLPSLLLRSKLQLEPGNL